MPCMAPEAIVEHERCCSCLESEEVDVEEKEAGIGESSKQRVAKMDMLRRPCEVGEKEEYTDLIEDARAPEKDFVQGEEEVEDAETDGRSVCRRIAVEARYCSPPQTCSSLTQPVNTDDSAKQFTEHLLFTYTYKNRAIFLCVKDVGDVCGFQNDDCFGVWGRQPRISGVNQNKRADGNTRCRPNKQRESERRDTSSTEGDAKTMWKKGNDKDTWTMVQLLRYMRPSVLLTIA